VLIGNPLTLAVIEIFAVPGAILGTLLYPLGLDAWVWHYVGLGIAFIIAAARFIGALPGSTIHLPAFAAWSLPFLAIAVSSAMIWRTALMRATAIPLLAVGLAGAVAGPTFDVAIAPSGDAVAVRQADGRLAVIGRRASAFDAEQWLRADADARDAKTVIFKETCDAAGCIGSLPGGGWLSLVLDRSAFAEDCQRAKVIVTPLLAPNGCAAPLIFDRRSLRQTGAVTLKADVNGLLTARTARAAQEDRPWSPAIQQPAIYWADGQPGGRRAEEAPEPQPAVRELQ
jgi:competence protein ComEC